MTRDEEDKKIGRMEALREVPMSTNQYRGKEETDKIDFSKLNPDEQKKASLDNISEEQDELSINEKIPQKARELKEEKDIKRIQ